MGLSKIRLPAPGSRTPVGPVIDLRHVRQQRRPHLPQICARKTARLAEQLRQAAWKPLSQTDADKECEFYYEPEGWSKPYRFVALCYEKRREQPNPGRTEQHRLLETSQYKYRVL